jgi:hypothetical protein
MNPNTGEVKPVTPGAEPAVNPPVTPPAAKDSLDPLAELNKAVEAARANQGTGGIAAPEPSSMASQAEVSPVTPSATPQEQFTNQFGDPSVSVQQPVETPAPASTDSLLTSEKPATKEIKDPFMDGPDGVNPALTNPISSIEDSALKTSEVKPSDVPDAAMKTAAELVMEKPEEATPAVEAAPKTEQTPEEKLEELWEDIGEYLKKTKDPTAV